MILFTTVLVGQTNLVPNPSFEDIDSCYGGFSPLGFDVFQWSGCTGWYNPTNASSDLWCNNGVVGSIQPPNLNPGYQLPRTGSNLAGLFILETSEWEYREYIQCELLSPLVENIIYEVSFWVNVAGNENQTSSIGAYFSHNQINNFSSFLYLPYNPQVANDNNNLITDTLGWSLVSGFYKAKGGEKFMTIGSFDDYYNINLTDYDSLTAYGIYMYIEDIETLESPFNYFIPNVFSPNDDQINDVFSPNVSNINEWKCLIYNRWGQEIYTLNNGVNSWDGRTSSGKKVPEGTYYYVFTASIENETISEKGFIELLR